MTIEEQCEEIFTLGNKEIIPWSKLNTNLAEQYYTFLKPSRNDSQFVMITTSRLHQVQEVIKANIPEALLSSHPYVRRTAELLNKEYANEV